MGTIEELFKETLAPPMGIPVYIMGKSASDTVESAPLDKDEMAVVTRCINEYKQGLAKVSPVLAELVERNRKFVVTCAGIAKETFPVKKNYMYPSQSGSLGILPLCPPAIKYATPSATYPCYSSYTLNSWDIPITANTAAYLFGDGTNYYQASPTTEKYSFIVVLKDGVIEVGTTPSIEHMRLYTEANKKWGVFVPHPLTEIPVEAGKMLYQYNTLAAVAEDHVTKLMWGFMPRRTGTARIILLGFVFFMHDFMPDLTTRT
jgi:hypothetical protein